MEKAVKKPRLEWLDALRGFTMILVVANHVSQMGFEQQWKLSSSLPFLLLFRMPLFFFVSGRAGPSIAEETTCADCTYRCLLRTLLCHHL